MLDYPDNDIYLHLDKKCNEDISDIQKGILHSGFYKIPSMDVKWGGVEAVNCELNLLKCATENNHYRYYHLLSGHDLPIKRQDIIHKWFDENERNYVSFYRPVMRENALYNYRIYHFQFKKYFWVRLSRELQSILHIDRVKKVVYSI